MLLRLESLAEAASVAALRDGRTCSVAQFVAGVRFRAAVLFSHVLKKDLSSCLCLYSDVSFHAVELIAAALSVNVAVLLLASPSVTTVNSLMDVLGSYHNVIIVADAGQRDALLDVSATTFFLDAGFRNSLLGRMGECCGPDLDFLLQSGVLSEVPALPSILAPASLVIVESSGVLVQTSFVQLCEPLLHVRLAVEPAVKVLVPQSALGRVLGLCLIVQTILCGGLLLLHEGGADADVTMPPLESGPSCLVLCEPGERARNAVEVVISHVSECGSLASLYRVEDHGLSGGRTICPVAVILLAALRFGSVCSFLYSRPHVVTPEHVLLTQWTRNNCTVSVKLRDAEKLQLAVFASCSAMTLGSQVPDWCAADMVAPKLIDTSLLLRMVDQGGLCLGSSFQLLQGNAEICEDRCRVPLARCSEFSVGLFNAILMSPLLLLLLLESSKRLMLPRQIGRAQLFLEGVPTRCFVKRRSDASFDVVAIDASARVVLKLESLVFLPLVDPLSVESFAVSYSQDRSNGSLLGNRSTTVTLLLPERDSPVPLVVADLVAQKQIALKKWGEEKHRGARKGVFLLVAAQWSNAQGVCDRLLTWSASMVVVLTQVQAFPQHAWFMGLARMSTFVHVVDVSSVARVSLEECLVSAKVSFLGAESQSLVLRYTTCGPRVRTGARHAWAVVGRGSAADAVARAAPMALRLDFLVAEALGPQPRIVVLCGKSLSRPPSVDAIQAFARDLPSRCRGIVVLSVESVFGKKLGDLTCAEYCFGLLPFRDNLTCLVCSVVDEESLEAAATESILRVPLWMVEEGTLARNDTSSGDLGSVASFSHLSPPFPSPLSSSSGQTCFVLGWSSRLASVQFPFLRDGHLWDDAIFERFVRPHSPDFVTVNLMEVSCEALSGVSSVSRGACFGPSQESASILARVSGLDQAFGVGGCALRSVMLACSMLRCGEVQLVLVATACEAAEVSGRVWLDKPCRPFDSRTYSACSSDGAAALVLSLSSSSSTSHSTVIGIDRFAAAQTFRKATLSQGCAWIATDASGAGDGDAAEYAALRRFVVPCASAVLDACKGRFGDTGVNASGLVNLVTAVASLQCKTLRRFHWFSELNPRIESCDRLVIPVEDVSFAGSPNFRACVQSASGGSIFQVALIVSVVAEKDKVDAFVCISLSARDDCALQHLKSCNSDWLKEKGLKELPRDVCLPFSMARPCCHFAVGGSAKALVESVERLQDLEHRSSAQNVWVGFSPSVVGISKALVSEVLALSSGNEATWRFSACSGGTGVSMQLLQFHVLAFDWLSSVVSFEAALNLVGIGMGSRNAVSAVLQQRRLFLDVVAACEKEDLAKSRLSRRVCVLECFAELSLVQNALQQLSKSAAVLCFTLLGPSCTAVVLRSSRFATEAERACRVVSIRCCTNKDADSALLWMLAQRSSPIQHDVRWPANCSVYDLGSGWNSRVHLLGDLWTRPGFSPTAWSTSMIAPGSVMIDVGGAGRSSVAMTLRKSARIACVSLVGRRASPLLALERVLCITALPCRRVSSAPAPFRKTDVLSSVLENVTQSAALSAGWQQVVLSAVVPGRPDLLESAWFRVVAHHPVLRSVLCDGQRVGVLPARVSSRWSGVSALAFEEFDAKQFPHFCMSRDALGVTLHLDSFGFGEDSWNVILGDWEWIAANPLAFLSSRPQVLEPKFFSRVAACGDGDDVMFASWSSRSVGRFDATVHSLSTLTTCLENLSLHVDAALVWRMVHADKWSQREWPARVVFQCCFCGCGTIECAGRDCETSVLLEQACAALAQTASLMEDRTLLHERLSVQDRLWGRAVMLSEALKRVGCKMGDAVVLLSSNVEDWKVVCLSVSWLGLVLANTEAVCIRAYLVDRRHMNQTRKYTCPVMIVDSFGAGKSGAEVLGNAVPEGSLDAGLDFIWDRTVSQRDLARLATSVVFQLSISVEDTLLFEAGESGALEFLIMSMTNCSVSSVAAKVSIVVVRKAWNESCTNARGAVLLVRGAKCASAVKTIEIPSKFLEK